MRPKIKTEVKEIKVVGKLVWAQPEHADSESNPKMSLGVRCYIGDAEGPAIEQALEEGGEWEMTLQKK